jgi:HlyD family secretion protein
MPKIRSFAVNIKNYAFAHKVISAIAVLVVVGGGYWMYAKAAGSSQPIKYVLGTVQTGTIVSTVSGSGQVSPSDEVTINPKASGTIAQVLVKDGAQVKSGQALAYLDATDEYNSVQSAKASLQSAQLNLQKLQEPATALQLTQDQDSVAKAQESEQNAQNDLQNTYTTSYSDIVASFLDLPTIQTQLQDIDTGTEASKGSQWNIDYYESVTENWDSLDASSYRNAAYAAYNAAAGAYTKAYADYQQTTQSSSTSTTQAILDETYSTVQSEQTALNSANSFIQFYENQVKNHNQTPSSEADTSINTLASDISKIDSHLTALLNDKNQIVSDEQSISDNQRTITENQETLQQLQSGPDALDIQSDELNIQQQQTSLQQAEDDLANYTITAPISGTIANLGLHVGDTVSSGTNAATLITDQDVADLSLNEVDAAKVAVGQQATLTFDAIPDLSLAGVVVDVSPLGTVSQGVVSYDVKIGFDTQDPRVKAGMTVNADIETAVHENVLEVPASAIKTLGTETYVQVFDPPLTGTSASSTSGVTTTQTPTNVPVTVGISDNTNTEIDSGLTAGEQIIKNTSSGSSAVSTAAATTRGGGGFGGGAGGGGIRL